MVYVSAGTSRNLFFGIAWAGGDLVATAHGDSQDEALELVISCVPAGVRPTQIDDPPPFVQDTIDMLAQLESGDESHKQFTLSGCIPLTVRRILRLAAAVPIGYVTSYGNIAYAAGSEARAVGRVMATNPLYPIVPCHRIVGSDFALVGYGGRQDEGALRAKLGRLHAESRGYDTPTEVLVRTDADSDDRGMTVYPVEFALDAANEIERRRREHEAVEAERLEAERLQLSLF